MDNCGTKRDHSTLSTDSSAAKGIATGNGLGKVKHLETRTLWAQDEGTVVVEMIGGDRNVADIEAEAGRVCRNLKPISWNSVLDPVFAHGMMENCPKLFMRRRASGGGARVGM